MIAHETFQRPGRTSRGVGLAIGVLLLVGTLAPRSSDADGFPAAPHVGVETGMHTEVPWRIAVDRAEKVLFSGSGDKTIRIWDLATGTLERTIRVPAAPGGLGRIYAIALSPDGRLIAAGGFTKPDGQAEQIYLIDRVSGGLLGQIEGLPGRVVHLAFSPDGRALAATLKHGYGLRLYATDGLAEIARDADYGDDSHWFDFAADGRLVTTSLDGFIRLYDPAFNLILKVRAPGGDKPVGVAFSPDGRVIAVGHMDTTEVDILAADDLRRLHRADTAGVDNGGLGTVAWSTDGERLCAAGTYLRDGLFAMRCWAERGRGAATETNFGATSTVVQLWPLRDRGLVVAATDPLLARLDAEGGVRWARRSEQADFRGQFGTASLRVSHSGDVVAFGFEQWGAQAARLDLAAGTLVRDPGLDPGLAGARTEAAGLVVQYWISSTPTLNGVPLVLDSHEMSRALAIAPDESRFVLGTEWAVRAYDRQGVQLWHVFTASVVWSVTITPDGQSVVAGLGDGTLRWYALKDGRELLAAFAHPDGRWVAWLPEGFFMASERGAELIGYHLNRPLPTLPDFVRLEQLFQRFYRPELVLARLAGDEGPIQMALAEVGDIDRLVQAARPPRLERFGPEEVRSESRSVVHKVLLEDAGSGIGELVYRVNGVQITPVASRVTLPRSGDGRVVVLQSLELDLGPNEVEVRALTPDRTVASEPVRQIIVVDDPLARPPALYGLAIGIDAYYDDALRLRHAASDAAALKAALEAGAASLFTPVDIRLLPDDRATKSGIEAAFRDLATRVEPQDVFILYLAGHGFAQEGRYHFVPQEVAYQNQETLRQGSLDEDALVALLSGIKAQKSLVILDTCYAGAFAQPQQLALLSRGLEEKAALDRLMRATGRAVLAASTEQTLALEGYQGHGLFSYALLEGLKGRADEVVDGNRNGSVTIAELKGFLDIRVPELSLEAFERRQIPMSYLAGHSFDLILAE
jgi:WD40 repeat protein